MPLTLTVTRGHTFTPGTPFGTADLNAAALPNVVLEGAVAGEDIDPGSVKSTHITPGPVAYSAAAGAVNAFTATVDPAPTSLVAGLWVCLKANATNTGPTTLNLNGLGNKGVYKLGATQLQAGDIVADQIFWVVYDGTKFQLTSPSSGPDFTYAEATGAVDTYAITLGSFTFNVLSDLEGRVILFKANAANTGACTLNINSKGATAIKKVGGTDPASGDLPSGALIAITYTGSVFQLLGQYGTASLPNVGTAGTYANPTQIVTDAQGRVTSVTAGTAPVGSIVAWGLFAGDTTVSTKSGGAAVAATDQITVTAHGWSTGQLVWLSSGESYTGPVANKAYWVQVIDVNTVKLCSDSAATNVVDCTADGGSATFNYWASSPITGGGNFLAVIRLSQGIYEVTYTAALASAVYAVNINAKSDSVLHTYEYLITAPIVVSRTTTTFRVECYDRKDAVLREAEAVDFVVIQ